MKAALVRSWTAPLEREASRLLRALRMPGARPPIVVLSFNRPNYLARVLDSMRAQIGIDIDAFDIYCFQDGRTNEYSGVEYATKEQINECVALFRARFPHGTVFEADRNLGVALNFERAESFVFDRLKSRSALFFEDDFELGPFYLKTLLSLSRLALRRGDVGYVCAYGDRFASKAEQEARAGELYPMQHNWAFALTRAQWKKNRPYVHDYLEAVRHLDYRHRNDATIARLFAQWGTDCPGTSQDAAKSIATALTGGVKISTFASFGNYIGQDGVHFSPDIFRRLGFEEAEAVGGDLFRRTEITDRDVIAARGDLLQWIRSKPVAAMAPKLDALG